MKIDVAIQTGSSKTRVDQTGDNVFKVYVHAHPKQGEANKALIEALSDYFGVTKGEIEIVSGLRSKNKVVNIISI